MAEPRDPGPLFADPRRLLLDMAQEQSLPELLRLIASRLGESPTAFVAALLGCDDDGCPEAAVGVPATA